MIRSYSALTRMPICIRTPHYVLSMITMPPQMGLTGNCNRIKMSQQKGPMEEEGGIIRKKEVDIRTLQSQCEQAISSAEIRTANELLNRIRQHSSPYGDGTERLAHYFDNALEARVWLALGQHYMLLLPSRGFQLLIL